MNTKTIRKMTAAVASGLLLAGAMPLVAMAATPTTTSLSPAFATAGSVAFALTVQGINFDTNAVVQVNGSPRSTTYNTSTQLVALIPASDIASPGALSVTVNNPSASGGISNSQTFTVLAALHPIPTLTAITPSAALAGSGAFTMTVQGSNFIPGSVVRFNGISQPTTYVSSTQLLAIIPASAIAVTGTHAVEVHTLAPGGGTSNMMFFTVNPITGTPNGQDDGQTPGLPNTGFGPEDDGLKTAGLTALLIGAISLASVALAAKLRKVWLNR